MSDYPKLLVLMLALVLSLICTVSITCLQVNAGMLGEQFEITTNHATWSPSVCYNPYSDKYLVLYQNAESGFMKLQGRCINASDHSISAEFFLSWPYFTKSCSRGEIAYNSDNHEWFVVYATDADIGGDIMGQRITSNGTLIGGPIPLMAEASYQETAVVAYDSDKKRYLVVWKDYRWNPVIRGCLFDANGSPVNDVNTIRDGSTPAPTFRISDNITLGCGYNQGVPKVAYNPVAKNFFVVWSDYRNFPLALSQICAQNNDYGDIFGQIINADGNRLTADKQIYPRLANPYVPEGLDLPSIVCNPMDGSYFIGITKLMPVGAEYGGWVTKGLIIDRNTNWLGNDFPVSDPYRGSCRGLVYNSHSNTYFWANGDTAEDISGRLFNASGQQQGNAITIITSPSPVEEIHGALAVRPSDGQYLQLAMGLNVYNLVGRFFNTYPPGPVTTPIATPDDRQVSLVWTNPSDSDFVGTIILYKTDGYPANPTDGTVVADKVNTPGSVGNFVHTNLINGTTYYYSLFSYNRFHKYSSPICINATPNAVTILKSDFVSPTSGWIYTGWGFDADPAKWGTIGWDGTVGYPSGAGIRCKGYGDTDSNDRSLREGGEIKRVVSTECYANVKLSYDLRVGSLGAAISGAGIGIGNVYSNDIQDQLLIYYSTTGISGPWIEADWLGRNDLLKYTSYGRRLIDLSSISGASDNADFALKFLWQFNTKIDVGDYGDLDNIKVTGSILGKNSYCSSVRSLANDTPVSFEGKVLYYKSGSVGYIEEDNRTSGIRIEGTSLSSASVNKLVSVAGKMQTKTNGERYIALDAVTPLGDGSVRALGVNNGAVKSAGMDGLLVTVWGTVKAGSVTANSFIITDGSDDEGIKIITSGSPGVNPDTYVTVTGAAGKENGKRVIYRK